MEIRAFEASDAAAIETLFVAVFSEAGGEAEGTMVGKLAHEMLATTNRRDLYGFVARDAARVLGAILFTRLTFTVDIEAFILSPVAVATTCQGQGVGSNLINYGIRKLAKDGVTLVTTYGDPAYYSRLGFQPLSTTVIQPPFELSQPVGWLGQSLDGATIERISGQCTCVEALNHPEYW